MFEPYPPIISYIMEPGADVSLAPKLDLENNGGIDLYALNDTPFLLTNPAASIYTAAVVASFRIKLPKGVHALVVGRSGNAWKGILPFYGLIDNSYRGQIKVLLYNSGFDADGNPTDASKSLFNRKNAVVTKGTRVAQLLLISYNPLIDLREAVLNEEFDFDYWVDSERGESGFGSTGDNI